MSDNVTKLHTKKSAEEPDALLDMAKGDFKAITVIGINKDDHLEARATTNVSTVELLYFLEQMKLHLLTLSSRAMEVDDDE